MTEDVGTTLRKPLTPTQRLKLFEAFQGRCVLCDRKIEVGEPWIDEHLRALGLGGSNVAENRGPAHKACAVAKAHGKDGDLARIAKAKRVKMRHIGVKTRKGPPMPGSKASPWKRRMDGTLERRSR